ncbi:MAG: hypothetical protein IJW77_07960 [Clostridia bacterium]|nr:hypothetical protein [Clostridia bacterium]
MRFIYDHDLHIHSRISPCGGDPNQTPQRILQYAVDNGLKTICITDHYWDSTVPHPYGTGAGQTTEQILSALPLPEADGIRFLFGAETEMDLDCTIGVGREMIERLDFIIVPLNHLHMTGFSCRGDEDAAERARWIVRRFDALLDADLPHHKVGLAHFTDGLIYPGGKNTDVLMRIPESEYRRLFGRAAELGIGIELNMPAAKADLREMTWEEDADELNVYRIAKEMGCKFYFGSDAHTVAGLGWAKRNAEKIIDLLDLDEQDKFTL